MRKFDVAIMTRFDTYHIEDADEVFLTDDRILGIVKGNKTTYFNWDRIEYYSFEEKEISE